MATSLQDPDRLLALARTGLMDAGPQEALDRITRFASRLLGTPIAAVSLVDAERQYFPSEIGLGLRETSLSSSLCTRVVVSDEALTVSDARCDPRIGTSLAIPEPGVIAYAGVPLTTSEGHTLGSLCVIEDVPREWSPSDVDLLTELAHSVISEIELRMANSRLRRSELEAQRAREHAEAITAAMAEGYALTVDGRIVAVNAALCEMTGFAREHLVDAGMPYPFWPTDRLDESREIRDRVVDGGGGTFAIELMRADGSRFDAEITAHPARHPDGSHLGFVNTIRDITERTQRDAEQRALRRIAELVAEQAGAAAVFAAVAAEVQRLFNAHSGFVSRYDTVAQVGTVVSGCLGDGEPMEQLSLDADTTGVAAPLVVGGTLWGTLSVGFTGTAVPADAEERLARFARLVSMAIANADAWDVLSRQASTDALTGLANHRTFQERLGAEVSRARRYDRHLSLVLLDLDHFKTVNDSFGHPTGDRVLAEVGRRLTAACREGELVARIGGEEFAWLLPETDRDGAYQAAERIRRVIESVPFPGVGTLTVSAGVCPGSREFDGDDLVRCADRALYWAKDGGRNTTFLYTDEAHALLTDRD